MLIYLVGFMGSGKSYLGQRLAQKLGYHFIDTDEMIEQITEKSVKELFKVYGEAYFRKCEYDLLQTFSKNQDAVVSTGGGMPCKSFNLDILLETGMVIYLDVKEDILVERLSKNNDERPLLNNISRKGLENYVAKTIEERKPFYEKAHLHYHFSQGDEPFVEEVAAYIKQFV